MFAEINPPFLIAALFFLASGCYLYLCIVTLKNSTKSKLRDDYLYGGVCLLIYSLCYGLMTITVNEILCRFFWATGFISSCLFFSRWLVFSSNMVTIKRRFIKHIINAASLISIVISGVCVLSNDAVFVMTKHGVHFSYHNSLYFAVVVIYISIIIFAFLFMFFRWWRESEMKRNRIQALLFLVLSAFIAPVGFATDLIMPTFTEHTAIPLASICFLPISMPLLISMLRYKTLSITVPNASGYVFNTVTIPTLVLDLKNNINLENKAALDFLGCSVIGKNISEILLSTEKISEESFLNCGFASEKVSVETPHGIRICDMLLAVENDKYNDVLCKVALLRDITENEHKDRMLKDALEQSNAASRAKSDFLSNMSHEIRTPMNAIIGMTSIAKSSSSIEKKDDALNKIDGASKHLLGVINDILDMSKIEADKLELSNVSFDFQKILQNVSNVISFRVEERRQKFYVNIGKDIPKTLIGDDQRLSQVITNLLGNAVKFTPDEGTIRLDSQLISIDEDTCRMQISVEDNGIGITDEQKSRLFRSFEQAETDTSRKFGGTGLGLAISKRIVELMGGDIWVESETGKGSKFIFTILMKYDTKTKKHLTDECINIYEMAEKEKNIICADDFSGYSILLVEDIEINREIVIALLEPTNLNVECAENGIQALRLFAESPEKYDLIFMDIQMPEMDGFEATRNIRALDIPKSKTIPIIAMTANVFREDIDKCLDAGMNGHLGKPLDFDDIISKLRKYLHSPKDKCD